MSQQKSRPIKPGHAARIAALRASALEAVKRTDAELEARARAYYKLDARSGRLVPRSVFFSLG